VIIKLLTFFYRYVKQGVSCFLLLILPSLSCGLYISLIVTSLFCALYQSIFPPVSSFKLCKMW